MIMSRSSPEERSIQVSKIFPDRVSIHGRLMKNILSTWRKTFSNHRPKSHGLEILRFVGPGLLVTVGFIDPGNWASNLSAGSDYGPGYVLCRVFEGSGANLSADRR